MVFSISWNNFFCLRAYLAILTKPISFEILKIPARFDGCTMIYLIARAQGLIAQSGLRTRRICMKKILQEPSKMSLRCTFVGTLSVLIISLACAGLVISPVSASDSVPAAPYTPQVTMGILSQPAAVLSGLFSGHAGDTDTEIADDNSTVQTRQVQATDNGSDTEVADDSNIVQPGQVSVTDNGPDTETADTNSTVRSSQVMRTGSGAAPEVPDNDGIV